MPTICTSALFLDCHLVLVNNLKHRRHIQETFVNKIILKYHYLKSSKNLTWFFFSNPVSFYGNYYVK